MPPVFPPNLHPKSTEPARSRLWGQNLRHAFTAAAGDVSKEIVLTVADVACPYSSIWWAAWVREDDHRHPGRAAWAGSPSLRLLHETDSSLPELEQLVSKSKIVGPAIHDARIDALCLAHGVTLLLTADRDFARFPKLKTRNPFTRP